jgi:pimeloyl-ACP methyl ester carboxylesterase
VDQLTRDGVVLAFEDAGKGAPPILLVHDPSLHPTSMRPQLEHFRGSHRVVVPNLRGHGRSQGPRRTNTLSAVADDLAWLCYELGVYRPVAIGHLVGGLIALELAARCPDLLAAVVTVDAPIEPACPSRYQHAPAQGRGAALEVPCPAAASGDEMGSGRSGAARSAVPLLCIEREARGGRVDTLREQYPRMVAPSLSPSRLHPDEAARQVNALIDAFLSEPFAVGASAASMPARSRRVAETGKRRDPGGIDA